MTCLHHERGAKSKPGAAAHRKQAHLQLDSCFSVTSIAQHWFTRICHPFKANALTTMASPARKQGPAMVWGSSTNLRNTNHIVTSLSLAHPRSLFKWAPQICHNPVIYLGGPCLVTVSSILTWMEPPPHISLHSLWCASAPKRCSNWGVASLSWWCLIHLGSGLLLLRCNPHTLCQLARAGAGAVGLSCLAYFAFSFI